MTLMITIMRAARTRMITTTPLSIHSNAEDTKSDVENDKDDADGNIAAVTIKFLLDDDADDERCNLQGGLVLRWLH